MLFILFFVLFRGIYSKITNNDLLCINFRCDEIGDQVCGIRTEGDGYKLRQFQSECALLKYGCEVGSDFAFGIISMDFCVRAFKNESTSTTGTAVKPSCESNCSASTDKVCGIKNDGDGFRVRLFANSCQLLKFNCEYEMEFAETDLQICNGVNLDTTPEITTQNNVNTLLNNTQDNAEIEPNANATVNDGPWNTTADEFDAKTNKIKNILVIDSSMIDVNHINRTIDDFFAATHVFDLPVKEVNSFSQNTRRRLVNIWGPVKVFKPWIIIPKNRSDDFDHRPTLSSCYHKCPRKCPDTYAPVCGIPGMVAREPTLMFQNHCFMDVAQCKMYWENKSPTSLSSSYIETSFLFCLGDQMNGMFRFLPLIRTLQRMGRLRSKGFYHYKIQNMKFLNERIQRQPKLMG